MGKAARPELTRASFSLPGEREWGVAEHSDGVFFAESASRRIGPFPAEAAHREAARQNECELLVCLAEAILLAEGGPELSQLAAEPRFGSADEPRLAAAILVLAEHGEHDERRETKRCPLVLVARFVALLEPGGVVVRQYDAAAEAEAHFEALCEAG